MNKFRQLMLEIPGKQPTQAADEKILDDCSSKLVFPNSFIFSFKLHKLLLFYMQESSEVEIVHSHVYSIIQFQQII